MTEGTVLVTGAGRGIGAACALAAARTGHPVLLTYRQSDEAAQNLAAQIRQSGGTAEIMKIDLLDLGQIEMLFDFLDRSMPPIKGLVNNAGVAGPRGLLTDLSDEAIAEIFQVNVFAAIACTRAAFRRMSTACGGAGGAIVMISSQAAIFGGAMMPAYAASKAALNSFVVGFAREAGRAGVRVNVVSPGLIDTAQQDGLSSEQREMLAASVPLGRMGTPAEVAEAVEWLLSPNAAYIAGAILPVHGAR
jgi:NAD(P)-dependent dehydrogenase (short-subunit alcohol dehydrogenase family)